MHSPLYHRVLLPLALGALGASAVLPANAAVVFRPGEKARYVAPGDEEESGNAQQLWQKAQQAEASGDWRTAQRAYRTIVRRYPKDRLAADAAFRFAQVTERLGDDLKAAAAYGVLVEQYPKSEHFEEAIEAQFRIGERYLQGKKLRLLGLPVRSALERASQIFATIVRTAPFGKYTARAQFNIGLVNEKQGNAEAAVKAYQTVVERYPDQPIAADAQYQIGYLWFNSAKKGVRDAKATENARTAFQDFLFRFPKSEKAAQARENLRRLETRQTSNAFDIARFYDKQKNYKAAVIYYNDVVRQQPGSPEGDRAKQRIEELRAKLGDAALQPAALTAATARKPPARQRSSASSSDSDSDDSDTPMRSSPEDVAPLPPPEYDESLPPPTSLSTDPAASEPGGMPSPSPSPSPEASPTPQ